MKTIHLRYLVIALLVAGPVALAQVHAGIGAPGAAGVGPNPIASPAQVGSGANRTADVGPNAVASPAQVGAGANRAADVPVQAPDAGENASVNANAAAQTQGHGAINGAAANPAVDIAASLNPSDTLRDIHETTFDARQSLVDEVKNRIATGKQDVKTLKSSAATIDDNSREKFAAALSTVKAEEKALKRCLKDARDATPDTWSQAQSALATNYANYVAALKELKDTLQS
jgi:hypothetical protein